LPVLGIWGSIIYSFFIRITHGIAFSSLTGIAGGFINCNKPIDKIIYGVYNLTN
jgi:hypothetical protein